MATVTFTENLKRHIDCPQLSADGETVRQVLTRAFEDYPKLGDYVLDEQGQLRKHMTLSVDGQMIADRHTLSDKVTPDSVIFVVQALSGG